MKEVYLEQLKQGIPLQAVDEMDFFYYLDILIYAAKNDPKNKKVTIDQIF